MEERSPPRIVITRPIRAGVIADYGVTALLLRQVLRQVVGRFNLARPTVMICIPAGVTSVESRAVLDATLQAGAPRGHPIPPPPAPPLRAAGPPAPARR